MTIETKFDLLDEVWAKYGNNVVVGKVVAVYVKSYITGITKTKATVITYRVDIGNGIKAVQMIEPLLFKTREDLITSL